MKVQCRANRGSDIPPRQRHTQHETRPEHRFNLTPGHEYVVYALGLDESGVWVYVADDAFVDGPRQYPLSLFVITDPRVSSHWLLANDLSDSEQSTMLAPREWLDETWFFNRVVDGEKKAVEIFDAIKTIVDAEADAH